MRSICLTLCIAMADPARADGASERESLALQACLSDYTVAEHQCFGVPYYTCMGEQWTVAPNPGLAQQRCLFQELAVWTDLIKDACDDLASVFEPGTREWDALCFNNNAPNWSYLMKKAVPPEQGKGSSKYSLRLSVEGARSYAVQLRMMLKAYRENR